MARSMDRALPTIAGLWGSAGVERLHEIDWSLFAHSAPLLARAHMLPVGRFPVTQRVFGPGRCSCPVPCGGYSMGAVRVCPILVAVVVVLIAMAPETRHVAATSTPAATLAPSFAPEQVFSPTANDWEPTVAADPSSDWVYQAVTYINASKVCSACPATAIFFRASSDSGKTWGDGPSDLCWAGLAVRPPGQGGDGWYRVRRLPAFLRPGERALGRTTSSSRSPGGAPTPRRTATWPG